MSKVVALIAVVMVVAIGWAVFSGNANLDITEQGRQSVQDVQHTAGQTAKQAGDAMLQGAQDALREGKHQVHKATAE